MDLLENPFHILTASPRDNRRRIMELADERSLLLNSRECMEARSDLTNPRKRLSAEIAWLPGIGPRRAGEVLSLLGSSPMELLSVDKLTSAARVNLLAAGLARLPEYKPDVVTEWILEIAWAFEDIDPQELSVIINEERVVSGFPEVTELSAVEDEIQERRTHYRQVIKSALENLSAKQLVETVTVAVESATDNGKEHGPILIADLVDLYEVEAQAFFEKEEGNIKFLVERLKDSVDAKRPDQILAQMVNQLIQVVKNWDTIAQPIQVSTKSRGLGHDSSYQIAELVRGLAIHMFNEHGKLEFSQQLTHMLQEVFAEVVDVAERTSEDVEALSEIAENRLQLLENEKIQTEEWRKEITYEAEIGVIFKDKFRISPDGIEWEGKVWDLNSITRVRWGGTRHSINGLPTGTVYYIMFGNSSDYAEISLRRQDIYRNFIDKLWSAVGYRLLNNLLKGLAEGKRYRFGEAIVGDTGLVLKKRKWIGDDERIHFLWNELFIWNGPGTFCVGNKTNKKISASFSYQEDDNIHLLEAVIRMLWKHGGNKLSSLLGG